MKTGAFKGDSNRLNYTLYLADNTTAFALIKWIIFNALICLEDSSATLTFINIGGH